MSRIDRRSFAFIPLADETETSLAGPAMDGFVDDVVGAVALRLRAKRRISTGTQGARALPEQTRTSKRVRAVMPAPKPAASRDWIRLQ